MDGFLGLVPLDGTSNDQLLICVRCTNSSDVIAEADATPTYRIFQPGNPPTVVTSGTGSLSLRHTGTITGAANNGAGLIRITDADHGLATGDRVIIASVGGTTEANATWTVTVISSSTFDLQSSTFTNPYTSGGTWTLLGLYSAQHSIASANYERGKTYFVSATYAVSSSTFSRLLSFTVV